MMLVKFETTTAESNSNDDSNDRISIAEAALKTMSINRDESGGVDVVINDTDDGMSPIEPSNPAEADLNREENRLATFEQEGSTWPPNAKMEPRKIAKAGLFYTGMHIFAQLSTSNQGFFRHYSSKTPRE